MIEAIEAAAPVGVVVGVKIDAAVVATVVENVA